jgi:hypothetical protein
MGGGAITAAFPGSAIGAHASVRQRFQSQHSFGRFAVGAHVVGRSPGSVTSLGSLRKVCVRPRGFPEPAAVGAHCCCSPAEYCGREWSLGAFGVALVSSLRVVSFGQCAQARGRAAIRAASVLRQAPIFTASVLKGVPGFMGAGLTFRSTGRRGGTAASTHPITHIFPRPSQHLAKSLISKDLFRSQATCQDSS